MARLCFLLKGWEDQPRDEIGRWGEGGGETASGKDVHSVARSTFSEADVKSIKDYTSDKTDPKRGIFKPAYREINMKLRDGGELPARLQKITAGLDGVMKEATLKNSIEVYRGIDKEFAAKLRVGASFTDKGFVSTTSDEKMADEWATGAVMKLTVKAGSRAASVAKLSKYKAEQEVLLDRGMTYRVTSITKNAAGKPVINVEVSKP